MSQPILRNHELETLRQLEHPWFRSHTIDITWPVAEGPTGCTKRIAQVCDEAHDAIAAGVNAIILSDRGVVPRPLRRSRALLAVAAVHHHLVREGTRLQAGLVLESGEPREIHHFATLIGYGASAINPYVMFETLDEMVATGAVKARRRSPTTPSCAPSRGSARACSRRSPRWGSRRSSPTAARRSSRPSASRRRSSTATSPAPRRGSAAWASTSSPRRRWTATRAASRPPPEDLLPTGGVYAWRRDGEHHMWGPETIAALQHAVRETNGTAEDKYREYSRLVNEHAARKATLRGLLQVRADLEPVPIDEVEPAKEIVKRFATGAMSLGSISTEAHETLAIAMNRLGGKSNTGEGGEDPRRFEPDANGDRRRSAIKQVASGRFGVTAHYLVNADQLQIKMAQGAKPGEGGQLPGPQGRQVHRLGAPHDAGRRPDLAAAAPRHLLDRGPQAAHLRPALRATRARRCR